MQAGRKQIEARENVYQFNKGDNEKTADEVTSALRDVSQPKTQKRGRFLRFLYWVQIMQDTNNGDGKLNSGLLFLLSFFFICMFGGLIAVVVIGGIFYLDMKDDFRGEHSWKDVYLNNNYKKIEKDCHDLQVIISAQQKYMEQNKLKVPPELLKLPDCKAVQQVPEKPPEH